MAPGKRRRDDVSELEEEESGTDDGSSRVDSGSQGKRPRRSRDASAHDGGTAVPDENNDGLDGIYTYQYTAPKYDASMNIDVFSSDEEEEEDLDEVRASELIKESMKKTQENMPSESGVIEEVSMKNFMCHARLTIPLGPLINFIIGHNGSGKSAILTALTICLGAKASVTNRGGKLSDFIKEGEENAWVSVKLKNEGENAYQPEIYGESIIVERHFTRAGASSFKIKNAEGRLVSNKKSDMENISDFFALQIDNPMNVLSQDLARQFLSNSTPSDKYRFFIRGTQLEQLDKDYALMEQYLDECEAKNEARQEDVAVLGEKKRKAEEKKKMMERTDTIQTQINETGWMFAWAQIEEQERNLAEYDAQILRHEENIERARRAADEASQIFDEEHNNHSANVEVIADLEAQLQPQKDAYQEIKDKFDQNKALLTESVTVQRQIKSDMKRHQNEIATARGKIEAEHERIENANGPAHAQKITQLEELKSAIPEHQQRFQQNRDLKPQLERTIQEAEREVASSQAPIDQKQSELQQAEGLLNTLQKDQGDQTRAFSSQIHAVIKAIQSERRFRDKPIGPMGLYVRLKKPEWASIIERTFGGNLDAFIVTNKQDQSILSDIMKRNRCQSNILIGNPRHIDVSQNEPAEGVDTILRVLDIDNDLVRNALIINQRVEQTVLIPRRAEASSFAQRRNPNVFSVMSHHDSIRGQGWRFDITRSGGNKTSPVPKWDRMIRMKTSLEDQIQLQRGVIQQIKQDQEQLRTQRRQKEIIVKDAKAAVLRHDQEAKRLREAYQRAQDRVQGLEDELNQDNVNDTGVLEELQHQLHDAESELQTAKDSFTDSIHQKDKVDELQRATKSEMDAAHAAVQELEMKIKKAKDRADQRDRTRHNALLKKNHTIGLLDEANREKQEIVQRRDTLAGQIETDLVPQAEEVHARIPVPENMTTDMLDAKLHALIKERDRVQQSIGGSRDRIYAAWKAASDAFRKGNDDLNQMIYNAKLIKNSLLHRKGRWRKFRKFITTRAQIIFMYLLSERGFRGRILVNHEEKMLDINVEPDMTKASDKGRQTRTLSGGEKSFSTICLLLSIWEAMGSPIRCLDEFDVFMDHANREVSMKMMVQAARRSVGRQFILITPQAMTAVQGWHDVKIFKMSDPERGQTTLPYGE